MLTVRAANMGKGYTEKCKMKKARNERPKKLSLNVPEKHQIDKPKIRRATKDRQ